MHFLVCCNIKMNLKHFLELRQLLNALVVEAFALHCDILTDLECICLGWKSLGFVFFFWTKSLRIQEVSYWWKETSRLDGFGSSFLWIYLLFAPYKVREELSPTQREQRTTREHKSRPTSSQQRRQQRHSRWLFQKTLHPFISRNPKTPL